MNGKIVERFLDEFCSTLSVPISFDFDYSTSLNLRISSWKPFFIQDYSVSFFFFFKLMDIDVNKVSQEFVESITLSLSQMNFLIFLFFFSPFFVSKSYLKNKFIE